MLTACTKIIIIVREACVTCVVSHHPNMTHIFVPPACPVWFTHPPLSYVKWIFIKKWWREFFPERQTDRMFDSATSSVLLVRTERLCSLFEYWFWHQLRRCEQQQTLVFPFDLTTSVSLGGHWKNNYLTSSYWQKPYGVTGLPNL